MNKSIRINKPCHENWNGMAQTEKGRHCASCCKEVVDFTHFSKEEILTHLDNATGGVCGRLQSNQLGYQASVVLKKPIFNRLRLIAASLLAVIGASLLLSKKAEAQKQYPIMGRLSFNPNTLDNVATNTQEKVVTGTITDKESGEPLPFCSVVIKSAGVTVGGATTDFDGKYKIVLSAGKVSNNKITVTAAFVGYKTKIFEDLPVNKENINLAMGLDFDLNANMMVVGLMIAEERTPLLNKVKQVLIPEKKNPEDFIEATLGEVVIVEDEDPILEIIEEDTAVTELVNIEKVPGNVTNNTNEDPVPGEIIDDIIMGDMIMVVHSNDSTDDDDNAVTDKETTDIDDDDDNAVTDKETTDIDDDDENAVTDRQTSETDDDVIIEVNNDTDLDHPLVYNKVDSFFYGLMPQNNIEDDEISQENIELIDEVSEIDDTPTNLIVDMDLISNLYPNPTTDHFKLVLSTSGKYNIVLLDATGRMVFNTQIDGIQTQIDTRNFKPGHYIVRISSAENGKAETRDVVIH